jgi:hypothetical protein
MALQGMGEGGKFPSADVSGKKENTFAASVGAIEIFEAFVDHDARDIFFGVAGKETEFGELASEGDEFSAKANAAEASVDGVDCEAEGDAKGASKRAGEHSEEFDPRPEKSVFEAFAQ